MGLGIVIHQAISNFYSFSYRTLSLGPLFGKEKVKGSKSSPVPGVNFTTEFDELSWIIRMTFNTLRLVCWFHLTWILPEVEKKITKFFSHFFFQKNYWFRLHHCRRSSHAYFFLVIQYREPSILVFVFSTNRLPV